MVFVFDLDDTVCETDKYSTYYIQDFFDRNSNQYPYKKVKDIDRFAEGKFSWKLPAALAWYKRYGDEMMLNFPCKANAIELIDALHTLGHKVVLATARTTDWHTNPEEITKKWIEKQGLQFDKIYFGRADKEKICEDEKANVFLDDDLDITAKVAQHFSGKKNMHVFLMTSKFNESRPTPKGVTRVQDFDDFAKKILKIQNNKKTETNKAK